MTNKFLELDFNQIKENLKDFLKSQEVYKDYNFEGSGLSVLLDILAYNTEYNGFYANMLAGESYIESAQLRKNIVSLAKPFGYEPRSVSAPVAKLKVDIVLPFLINNPSFIKINKNQPLTSKVGNKTITTYPVQDYIITKTSSSFVEDTYSAEIEIFEGVRLTHKFFVDSDVYKYQKFVLPNINIDSNKIFVTVYDNQNLDNAQTYKKVTNVLLSKPTDFIFYAEENVNQHTELFFGDDVVGFKLKNGQVIDVVYFTSSGSVYNNVLNFITQNLVSDINTIITTNNITLTTLQPLSFGKDREDTEFIRKMARRHYTTQNRAVTASDYETILLSEFNDIEYIRVYSGEFSDTYGVVFVTAKPKNALTFSNIEKTQIKNLLKSKNTLSIQVEVVDPDYLTILSNISITKDSKTNKTNTEIEQSIRNSVTKFYNDNLIGFDRQFYFSKFSSSIDDSDSSILSNTTSIQLRYDFQTVLNANNIIDIDFQSKISSFKSSNFIYNGFTSFIEDESGILNYYRFFGSQKIIVNEMVGTIDYSTGKVYIPNFNVSGIVTGGLTSSFFAIPDSFDLISNKNRILLLEIERVSIK